jgi:hypothetical protein
MWLRSIDDLPHLLLLLIRQLDIPGSPILFQSMGLSGAWNRNHTLSRNPRKRDLRCGAAFFRGELLHLLNNSLVLVKVFALELGN